MLTIIELPLQILEMTQSSTFMEHWTFREHEIQKGGPQIMTSWYDDVVPGMLPIFGHGSDNACSTCHMHACVNTRVVPRVTLYTAGHLHTAVPHCSHSRAPIVHTAVPRENNEHGCVYLRCRAVCKLPGCVEGHPWVPSSAAQTWYEGEKSDGHTMSSFVLNPKFRWSIGDGRAHR